MQYNKLIMSYSDKYIIISFRIQHCELYLRSLYSYICQS